MTYLILIGSQELNFLFRIHVPIVPTSENLPIVPTAPSPDELHAYSSDVKFQSENNESKPFVKIDTSIPDLPPPTYDAACSSKI